MSQSGSSSQGSLGRQPGSDGYGGYQSQPSNGLGLAGFIVSLVGLVVTLGVLCPIGFILSLIAVFKPPRGFAVAGLIISVIGTGMAGLLIYLVFYAINSATTGFTTLMVQTDLDQATISIEEHYDLNSALPDDTEGNALISGRYDTWGEPIVYRKDGETAYTLISSGPDMIPGNGDDIAKPYTAGFTHHFGGHGYPFDDIEQEPAARDDPAFMCVQNDLAANFSGKAPPAEQAQPHIDAHPDRHGNPLRYTPVFETMYKLESAGADGQWGTEDDLNVIANVPEAATP